TNPARERQFLVLACEVRTEYAFRARVVSRERCPPGGSGPRLRKPAEEPVTPIRLHPASLSTGESVHEPRSALRPRLRQTRAAARHPPAADLQPAARQRADSPHLAHLHPLLGAARPAPGHDPDAGLPVVPDGPERHVLLRLARART